MIKLFDRFKNRVTFQKEKASWYEMSKSTLDSWENSSEKVPVFIYTIDIDLSMENNHTFLCINKWNDSLTIGSATISSSTFFTSYGKVHDLEKIKKLDYIKDKYFKDRKDRQDNNYKKLNELLDLTYNGEIK